MSNSLTDFIESAFIDSSRDLLRRREFFEYVWRGLKSTLGTQNQDLIDLYLLGALVASGEFDCIVEVGRGGGTVTSIVYGLKNPAVKFVSICPQKTFREETLPLLQASAFSTGESNSYIKEGVLEGYPLLKDLKSANSILILFDAAHNKTFAEYYLRNIVGPLGGKKVLVGVHDIYCPAIQPLSHPNQWDDPNGPFPVNDLACRWDEIVPIMEYISKNGVSYAQTGLFFQRVLKEHPELDDYWREISTVRVPPYSTLWPFEGQAGTWLFFEVGKNPEQLSKVSQTASWARRALTIKVPSIVRSALRFVRATRLRSRVRAVWAAAINPDTASLGPVPLNLESREPLVNEESAQLDRMLKEDPALGAAFKEWLSKKHEHSSAPGSAEAEYLYYEMLRKHASESHLSYAVLPLFSIPLLLQARRIVEFGSSFTFYPKTYASPWGVSSAADEGMISTRILLAACRFLNQAGIPAKLISIELRPHAIYEGVDISESGPRLFKDLALLDYWDFQMGVNSVDWLKRESERIKDGQEDPIDFAFSDSNHTHDQTSQELGYLAPLMSARGVIALDNCFVLNYQPGVEWSPGESSEGVRQGGKFGAILAFLESHPDWEAEWPIYPGEIVTLRRKGQLKTAEGGESGC